MPTPLLPDTLDLARTALLAQPSLTALVGTRILPRIPASPVWPLLVLTVVDSGELEWHTGEARVQVDVWGAGGQDADWQAVYTIARTLVSVARDLRGAYGPGRIANSAPASTVPQPDQTTGRARLVVDLILHTAP